MVPQTPIETAFNTLIDALRDYYPDGVGLSEMQQIEVLTLLARLAEVLDLNIPED